MLHRVTQPTTAYSFLHDAGLSAAAVAAVAAAVAVAVAAAAAVFTKGGPATTT